MSFEKHLKNIGWTGAEIAVTVGGGIVATKFLDDRKLFKEKFASNPSWFEGSREGAPFMIKWSGGLKAAGSIFAASYVKNPWFKLVLFGIAYQGLVQQARVLTWDKTKNESRVGASSEDAKLDAELRALAEKHRTSGAEETSGHESAIASEMDGPEYLGATHDLGDRYQSAVAYAELGDRYQSSVAGVWDEDKAMGFNFHGSDSTTVGAYEE